VGAAPVVVSATGGRRVPMTCRPWSRSLTVGLLERPATTVKELSTGLTVTTGNLSAVTATTMST